jgi:L-lysine 2,3-aminomutase
MPKKASDAWAWATKQKARLNVTKIKRAARLKAEKARRVEAVKKIIEMAVEKGKEKFEYPAGIEPELRQLLAKDFIRVIGTDCPNVYQFAFLVE